MSRFQSPFRTRTAESAQSTLSAARRARWIAGGALNLFALVLVASQVWPSLSA